MIFRTNAGTNGKIVYNYMLLWLPRVKPSEKWDSIIQQQMSQGMTRNIGFNKYTYYTRSDPIAYSYCWNKTPKSFLTYSKTRLYYFWILGFKAIHARAPIKLKLTYANLQGEHDIYLTPRQMKKLEKAHALHKGIQISFSTAQLKHMGKESGFILPLLASLAGSFLPGLISTGVDYIKDKVAGKGIQRHGVSDHYDMMYPEGSKNSHDVPSMEITKRGASQHEGGFLGPLLAGLASGIIGNLVSGAVNQGVREKAGVDWNGKGLAQLGTGLVQLGQGEKKASGLTQLGVSHLPRAKAGMGSYNIRALNNANSLQVI